MRHNRFWFRSQSIHAKKMRSAANNDNIILYRGQDLVKFCYE